MAVRLGPIVVGLCLLGCKPKPCDSSKADLLIERLASADPHEHPDLIAEELGRVCALPEFASAYLDVMAGEDGRSWRTKATAYELSAESFARACPDVENLKAPGFGPDRNALLYDRCDLARFDVVSREDFLRQPFGSPVLWAIHQWLLDNGLSPQQAQILTRTLLMFERRWASPVENLVPRLDGDLRAPIRYTAKVVQISATELSAFDLRIADLQAGRLAAADLQGHVIRHLYQELESEREKQGELAEALGEGWTDQFVIAADPATPFATVVDVLYTAGRAGFRDMGIAVETSPFEFDALPLDLRGTDPVSLNVYVSDEGYRLRERDQASIEIARDASILRERALAICSRDPIARGMVSAANDVALEHVVEAIVALRGPRCRADGTGDCCMARVGLQAGAD